jgi:hypothetical protein
MKTLLIFLSIFFTLPSIYAADQGDMQIGNIEYQKHEGLIRKPFIIDYYALRPACFVCIIGDLFDRWSALSPELRDSVQINIYSNDRKFIDEYSESVKKRGLTQYSLYKISDIEANKKKEFSGYAIYTNEYSAKSHKFKIKNSSKIQEVLFRDFDSTMYANEKNIDLFSIKSKSKIKADFYQSRDFIFTVLDSGYCAFFTQYWRDRQFNSKFEFVKEFDYLPKNFNGKYVKDSCVDWLRKTVTVGDTHYGFFTRLSGLVDTIENNERVISRKKSESIFGSFSMKPDTSENAVQVIAQLPNWASLLSLSPDKKNLWLESAEYKYSESSKKYLKDKVAYYFYPIGGDLKKIEVDTNKYCYGEELGSIYKDDFYFLNYDGSFYKISKDGSSEFLYKIYLPYGIRTFTHFDGEYLSVSLRVNDENKLIIYDSLGTRMSRLIQIPFYATAYYSSKDKLIKAFYEDDSTKNWRFEEFEFEAKKKK